MAYATLADLKFTLGSSADADDPGVYEQLTSRVGPSTGDDAVGQDALDRACAMIDGRLAKRYRVPFDVGTDATLAADLRDLTLKLAVGRLYRSHPIESSEDADRDYKEAIARLAAIANDEDNLAGVDPIPDSTMQGKDAYTVGRPKVFGKEGWI